MARQCGRTPAFLVLAGAISVCSLMLVWNFTTAQVSLKTELAITKPDKAFIATKNFSARDGKVILNGRAIIRTAKIVGIYADGTAETNISSYREPANLVVQNNLDRPVEIRITPNCSRAPAGVYARMEPEESRVSPGALCDFRIQLYDEIIPSSDENFDFEIPVGIEALWEQGRANIKAVVPARVLRRVEERVVSNMAAQEEGSSEQACTTASSSPKSEVATADTETETISPLSAASSTANNPDKKRIDVSAETWSKEKGNDSLRVFAPE